MRKLAAALSVFALSLTTICHSADLLTYVQKPDSSFKWEKVSQSDGPLCPSYKLKMTSQVWQGITWEHEIEVFVPSNSDHPGTAFLWITAGKPGDGQGHIASLVAASSGCPAAVLYGIPNQPLFGGLKEDALIAHTFVKTLETDDLTWPLLFPMTKSALRAMDAVQALSRSELKSEITDFVVSGASKRGWTTWLTAAADPVRVKGIMPMVYDNLNLVRQMPHQIASWGNYSESIHDYTERGIQETLQTERGRKLASIVDPWTYRSRIKMPKLIVNGTNDPYWTQDALNIYWNDLTGQKMVLYVPNGGHGLGDLPRVLSAMTVFTRVIASGASIPSVSWEHKTGKDSHCLTITAAPSGSTANLWTAKSDTLDFRKSKWELTPMMATDAGFNRKTPLPASGYMAVFGEVSIGMGDRTTNVSTQIEILDPNGPVEPK